MPSVLFFIPLFTFTSAQTVGSLNTRAILEHGFLGASFDGSCEAVPHISLGKIPENQWVLARYLTVREMLPFSLELEMKTVWIWMEVVVLPLRAQCWGFQGRIQ